MREECTEEWHNLETSKNSKSLEKNHPFNGFRWIYIVWSCDLSTNDLSVLRVYVYKYSIDFLRKVIRSQINSKLPLPPLTATFTSVSTMFSQYYVSTSRRVDDLKQIVLFSVVLFTGDGNVSLFSFGFDQVLDSSQLHSEDAKYVCTV